MNEYFVTATDSTGIRRTHQLSGDSAQHVIDELEAGGFIDIHLHTDDFSAELSDQFAVDGALHQEPVPDLGTSSEWPYFLLELRRTLTHFAVWIVATVLGGIVLTVLGHTEFAIVLLVVVALLPVGLALRAVMPGHQRRYYLMLDASCRGQWQEALDLIPSLRGHVLALELDVREACARAGLGQSDAVQQLVERILAADEQPEWMRQVYVAEIYEALGQYDEALEQSRLALELDPANPLLELNYAQALLVLEREPTRARQLLGSAESKPLGDLLEPAARFVHGLLELNTNRNQQAIEQFDAALRMLAPTERVSPAIGLLNDLIRAHRAVALAKTRETVAAQRAVEQCLPRLVAIDHQPIVQRLRCEGLGSD